MTLHRELHSLIHDCPTPRGEDCRRVYQELCRQEQVGLIRLDDPPWVKLEWLIEQLEDTCPATTAILRWQKEKITKFYKES